MKNVPELLISTDDVDCQIYCDKLTRKGIRFEVKDSDIKTAYAGASLFGKYIFVEKSDIKRSREILGLNKKSKYFKRPAWFRGIVLLYFILFIISATVLIISIF